jgi:hypothetical protein
MDHDPSAQPAATCTHAIGGSGKEKSGRQKSLGNFVAGESPINLCLRKGATQTGFPLSSTSIN